MKYAAIFLCLVCALFDAGCHKQQPMQIEGVWRGIEPPHWVLIVSDGYLQRRLTWEQYLLEYAYRRDKDTVYLEPLIPAGMPRKQVWQIDGQYLTVVEIGQDVPVMSYKKVSE